MASRLQQAAATAVNLSSKFTFGLKNAVTGIDIFMDRFLTFFVVSLIVAGGIGAFAVFQFIDSR
jgi:hypothetical protein